MTDRCQLPIPSGYRPPIGISEDLLDQLADVVENEWTALAIAILVAGVAVVYLVMGFGLRHGELIWSGRHVGRLPDEQRWWSLLHGLALLLSAGVILEISGVTDIGVIPSRWLESAGILVTAYLGITAIIGLLRGSAWERMIFTPITLLGCGLVGWLTFT